MHHHIRTAPTGRALAGTLLAVSLLVAACTTPVSPLPDGATSAPPTPSRTVTLVTHDSFALSEEVLAGFEAATGYELVVHAAGPTGALVNQLILTANSPLGDAVYGIDSTFASRAVDGGVLAPYTSPAAPAGFPTFDGHLTAIDQGDVCLNVDSAWFAENAVPAPATFEDLLKEEYRDLTVVTNPATSSPGLAFLLATIAHFGEGGWQEYWQALLRNGTRVAESWSEAYYVDFSGSTGEGSRPIVLSYSSSPAAELGEDGTPRTANVSATCFRQMSFAGVLAGAANPAGAAALVDWLLSPEVQNDIPGQMYVYPVIPDAVLPAEWERFASLTEDPLWLEPAEIAANRDEWLAEWLEIVG